MAQAQARISEVEEKRLWKRFREQGDVAAREQIAVHYVHLVKYVINRLTALSQLETEVIDYDDLYSTGVLGLLAAIDNYDTEREVKFITYAVPRIRGAIIDYLRTMDWLPRSLRQKVNQLQRAQSRLETEMGRAPTEEDLAGALGVSTDEIQDTLYAANKSIMLSLDEEVTYADEGKTALVNLTAARGSDPRKGIQREQVVNILERSITQLPEKEMQVVVMYYHREMTFKEIGSVLEVTESRVCQLHSKAMMRLKTRLGEAAADLTSIV